MQSDLDRTRRDPGQLGNRVGVHLFDVTQQENLAVGVGEFGDAGSNLRLCLLLSGRSQRRITPARSRLCLMPVGDERRQQVFNRLFSLVTLTSQLHQRRIDHDTVQPRCQLRLPFKAVDRTEGRDKGFLHGVAGIVFRVEHPPCHGQQSSAVVSHQWLERRTLSSAQQSNKREVVVRVVVAR